MKIPVKIIKTIELIAKKHSDIKKLENQLSSWLDKKGIEFDALDEGGCAYAFLQDGFSDELIEVLKEKGEGNE